jgi:hypothetical protein
MATKSKGKKKDERPQWLREMHGTDCDCMSCHEYKPDKHRPVYGLNLDGSWYHCPDCWEHFWTYRACMKHMGKVVNIMTTCNAFQASGKYTGYAI